MAIIVEYFLSSLLNLRERCDDKDAYKVLTESDFF